MAAVLDLADRALARPADEALAELRLLYVAMTRARRAYLGVANLSPGPPAPACNGSGHLLLGPGDEQRRRTGGRRGVAGLRSRFAWKCWMPELSPPTHLAVTPRLAVLRPWRRYSDRVGA